MHLHYVFTVFVDFLMGYNILLYNQSARYYNVIKYNILFKKFCASEDHS